MGDYRIGELAARSGFPPATLRYYEQIGLLDPPARTASGYRVFDERAVERLGFIARAKQLGCSLEDVAQLVAVWQGGACGPVQDRLREVVAGGVARADAQIAELTRLRTELTEAAAALEGHRPDGPCDDDCGCLTGPGPDPSAAGQPIRLGPRRGAGPLPADPPRDESEPMLFSGSRPPIVCSLPLVELPSRLDAWRAVAGRAVAQLAIAGGYRLVFGDDVALGELADLAAAEHACCPFLDFTLTIDQRGAALEVRAPAEALAAIEALVGVAR